MDFEKLKEKCQGKTLLGVGPVTRNVTKAALRIAENENVPMILIPSRRQVETSNLGGGYVYDTKQFCDFVNKYNTKGNIIMARDHGGPYQGTNESNLQEIQAFAKALISYEDDIKYGFNILHIDPSLNPYTTEFEYLKQNVAILFERCEEFAKKHGKDIIYEIGTDGHGMHPSDETQIKDLISYMKSKDVENKIKFIVANTGTCVKEKCNVGKFNVNKAVDFVKICNDNSLWLKEHNCDYVDFESLKMHNKFGIHSVNVAPEFGVEETKTLLFLLNDFKMFNEHDDFIRMAYESRKWEKWMLNGEHPDKEYLATICGHYIMEDERVKEIKLKLEKYVAVEAMMIMRLENSIKRYLRAFNWNV